MVVAIARPKLEGNIAVGEDRRIGFAEFGDPQGRAVFWLHGTPGARRQIPIEARVFAEQRNIRLIGVDRPGIGSSTPFQYENVLAFADDLAHHRRHPGHRQDGRRRPVRRRPLHAGLRGGHAGADRRGRRARWRRADGRAGRDRRRADGAGHAGRSRHPSCRRTDPVGRQYPDPADPAGRRAGRLPVCRDLAGRRTARCWCAPSSRRCSSTTCSTAAANSWRRRSPTSSSSPGTGVSGSTRSRCRSAGGTATATTSCRSPTVSTWSPLLPDAELYHLPGESHLAGLGRAEDILNAMLDIWDRDETH